jgi:hypothetical protein
MRIFLVRCEGDSDFEECFPISIITPIAPITREERAEIQEECRKKLLGTRQSCKKQPREGQ